MKNKFLILMSLFIFTAGCSEESAGTYDISFGIDTVETVAESSVSFISQPEREDFEFREKKDDDGNVSGIYIMVDGYVYSMISGRFVEDIEDKMIYDKDFDFDGFCDLYLPYSEEKGIYYRYDPDIRSFEYWNELNDIRYKLDTGISANVSIGQCLSYTDGNNTYIYKWEDDKLVLREHLISENGENIEKYYVDDDGNEILAEG